MSKKSKFDFSQVLILENERVCLAPLHEDHLDGLSKISKEAYIWRYFFENGVEEEALKAYVRSALLKRNAGMEYPFVVFDKIENKVAGSTRFYEYDPQMKTIKLGHTWYGSSFRGTGLNKHCKYLLFKYAFEKLGVERVGFGVYASNQVSIAALKSVGCKVEGKLRAMFPAIEGQGREDAILLSILRDEWKKDVKQNLKIKLRLDSQ